MKKIIVPILFLIIFNSCSHLKKWRAPSSTGGENCFSVLGKIYDETSPSYIAITRLNEIENQLGDSTKGPEKVLEFEEYLSDLYSKILLFEDSKLEQSWVSLMSSFQQYKYSDSSFDSFKSTWNNYKKSFFQKWRDAEKKQLLKKIKKSEDVSKIELEAQSIVNELKSEEMDALELVDRRSAIIHGVWAKLRSQSTHINSDSNRYYKDEMREFSYWLFSKADLDKFKGEDVYDSINIWLKEYRDLAKHMSKNTRNNMITEGKKNLLTLYNQVTIKHIDDITSIDELKKQSLIELDLFSLLETKFDQEGFRKYLLENNFFSEGSLKRYRGIRDAEGIDVNLGMMLRDQYQKFAPFQDHPPVMNKNFTEMTVERARGLWDKLSKGQKSCADLDCYNEEAKNGWLKIFKSHTYRNALSCLKSNPVVLKSMVMDLGLIWGGLTWYYNQNPDSFQHFPIEIMVNGAAFAPIMAEANCRASFKGDLAFGTQIPEKEVITNLLTRTNRGFKKLRGVMFKGFLSSVGLLSVSSGFDHIFLALGHQVATPLSINDIAVLLPISFLYHGVWLGVKNLAVMNPIRHKIIPRLAQAIAKKMGISKAYWPLQTGLDFGAYHSFAVLGKWDYMIFYTGVLFPFIQQHLPVGNDLEHKQVLIKDNVVEHTFRGKSESGVETKVVITENKKGSPSFGESGASQKNERGGNHSSENKKGTVQVKSVDIEVSDKMIDRWADKIISGLPSGN